MMKLLQLSLILLSAVSAMGAGGEPQCEQYHTCDCFTCGDVTENENGTMDIQIDHCKDDTISWICCTAVDGIDGACDVTTCGGEKKCNTMSSGEFTVNVPQDAKSFTINTHDGKTAGDALNVRDICGGPPGGQGGSCVDETYTAHCLIDFDIAEQCGYTPPAPAPEEPAPAPEEPASTRTSQASGSGDPHFKTWNGHKYDYHGECDLVLVDNPTFADGLGLRVHIRTTRVKYFSYIQKVALQIGNDVLEFDNDVENFLINGAKVEANRKHHKTHLGGFFIRRDPKAVSVRLHKEGKAKIDFHTRANGFPAVIVDGGSTDIFKGSLGLLGDWQTGKRFARDGKTELNGHDATAFALEWQVRDTEPLLFSDARFPQYPTTCTPPSKRLANRLGVSTFEKEAEKACAHWDEDFEDCVFDVIATRDVLVAAEGHIVHIE